MIRVTPQPEPSTFEADVRLPGLRAIAEMVGKAPNQPRTAGSAFKQRVDRSGTPITVESNLPSSEFKPYWDALDDLKTAYQHICAYSCFYIHPNTGSATVDHMAPKSRDWTQVYEWTNYRLCCSLMNARKGNFEDISDPFEVQDGWFVLELVGFQILPASELDQPIRTKIWDTINRLKLNDEAFLRIRESHYNDLKAGDVDFSHLAEQSPFLAHEILRQIELG